MSTISRLCLICLFTIISASVLGGCGGAGTNNDQGTSFLAVGFFDADRNGENGQISPLFVDSNAQNGVLAGLDGVALTTFIGLQNRLTSQFLRLTRVDCSYDIPGSGLAIPDDASLLSTVLNPSPGPAANGAGGEVPVAIDPQNIGISEFVIVSPDIFAFINVNQNFLPQLPFRMNILCSATAISQAGDVFTSNPISYFVQFSEIAECCTGGVVPVDPGFPQGEGTGGDITFGNSDGDQAAEAG